MADPFGRPETLQETLDYLGAPTEVTVQGQPALPVTGGGALGATESPTTVGGGGFAAPGDGAGGGGGGAGGGGAGGEDGRPISAGSNWWNEAARWISPATKLVNVANRVFNRPPTAAEQTAEPVPTDIGAMQPGPAGAQTVPAPPPEPTAIPPGEPAPGEALPTTPVAPFEPPPTGPQPPIGEPAPGEAIPTGPITAAPSSTLANPIPDEIVNMFGGDRAAVEAAFNSARESVTPEMIATMADSGQLAAVGIESSAGLTPAQISNLQTGIAVAGLVLAGLQAAGVLPDEAGMIIGSMLGLVSGGFAIAALPTAISALTGIAIAGVDAAAAASMSTVSAVGAVAGGVSAVLAPFIAWGMHELMEEMGPNLHTYARQYGAESWTQTVAPINAFNNLVKMVRDKGLTDPALLNQLMLLGERAILPFYTSEYEINALGDRTSSGPTGPVWHAKELAEHTGDWSAWQPVWDAANNMAALDQMTGSKYAGQPQWYAAFYGDLNPALGPTEEERFQQFEQQYPGVPRGWNIESGEGSYYWNPSSEWTQFSGQYNTPDATWGPGGAAAWNTVNWDAVRRQAQGMDPLDFAIRNWSGNPLTPQNLSIPYNTPQGGNLFVRGWNPQTWNAVASTTQPGGAPAPAAAPAATTPTEDVEVAPEGTTTARTRVPGARLRGEGSESQLLKDARKRKR